MSESILNTNFRVRKATCFMQWCLQLRRSILPKFRAQFRLFIHHYRIVFIRLQTTNSTTACLSLLSPKKKESIGCLRASTNKGNCFINRWKNKARAQPPVHPLFTTGSPPFLHRFICGLSAVYQQDEKRSSFLECSSVHRHFLVFAKPFFFRGCPGICEELVYFTMLSARAMEWSPHTWCLLISCVALAAHTGHVSNKATRHHLLCYTVLLCSATSYYDRSYHIIQFVFYSYWFGF